MVVTAGPTASPRVQYAYSFAPSGTTNHSRPTSMTYPDGKVINDTYTAGLDATISRLSLLSVNSVAVESYDYLGLATVVKRGHGGDRAVEREPATLQVVDRVGRGQRRWPPGGHRGRVSRRVGLPGPGRRGRGR